MRSVFLHLRDVTEQSLDSFFEQFCRRGRGPRWVVAVDDDPYLYVDFYPDAQRECETDEWIALTKTLGGEPAVNLIVDVSGRHAGDQQVKEFVSAVLSKFPGVAKDEYTEHCWTLEEVLSGHHEEGHPFFDYNGWHREQQEQ